MHTGSWRADIILAGQTELDGKPADYTRAPEIGSVWSWFGRPLCLKSYSSWEADDLPLALTASASRVIHRRRSAQKPFGQTPHNAIKGSAYRRSVHLSDGNAFYLAGLDFILPPNAKPTDAAEPIFVFIDNMPPPDVDLSVTRVEGFDLRPGLRHDVPHATAGFLTGTRIQTPDGERPVEDLTAGDVVTCENGAERPILWKSRTQISGARLLAYPHLRPIILQHDVVNFAPLERPIKLGPGQLLKVPGISGDAIFGEEAYFVRLQDILTQNIVGVAASSAGFTCHHLFFEEHQTVFAQGVACASFHPVDTQVPGPLNLDGLHRAFPPVAQGAWAYGTHAYRTLTRAQAAMLLSMRKLRR